MSITFLAFVLERVKDGSWKDPSLKNKTKQTETSLGIQVLCLQNYAQCQLIQVLVSH